MKSVIIFILSFILLAGNYLPVNAVCAPPVFPSSFYGAVYGVPLGGQIEVYISDIKVAWGNTLLYNDMIVYSIDVKGDDLCTPEIDGGVTDSVITFIYKNKILGTGIWRSGTNIRLDLIRLKGKSAGKQ